MSAAAQSHHGMQPESEREKAKHVPFKDHDKTIMKVSSFTSPRGPHGEKYLASAKKCGPRSHALCECHYNQFAERALAQGGHAPVGERAAE